MIGLIEFARTKGAKDKKPRKRRNNAELAVLLGGASAGAGVDAYYKNQDLKKANKELANSLKDLELNKEMLADIDKGNDRWDRDVRAEKELQKRLDDVKRSTRNMYVESRARAKERLALDNRRIKPSSRARKKQAAKLRPYFEKAGRNIRDIQGQLKEFENARTARKATVQSRINTIKGVIEARKEVANVARLKHRASVIGAGVLGVGALGVLAMDRFRGRGKKNA